MLPECASVPDKAESNDSFERLPTSLQGRQEPPDQDKAERQQTEWTGRWLCICQLAGISLNPSLASRSTARPVRSRL